MERFHPGPSVVLRVSDRGAFSWQRRQGSLLEQIAVGRFRQAERQVIDHRHVYDSIISPPGHAGWTDTIWNGYQHHPTVATELAAYAVPAGGAGGLTNPVTILRQLRTDASSTSTVGRARVGGVPTTEERITVPFDRVDPSPADLRRYEQGSGSSDVVFAVWLDADGRLAQVQLALHLPGPTETEQIAPPSVDFDLTVGFSHYRTPVTISVPPPSAVTQVQHCRPTANGSSCGGGGITIG